MAILLNVVEHGKDVIIIILKLTNLFAWLQCTINCLSWFPNYVSLLHSVTHNSRCTMQGCLLKNLLAMLQSPSSSVSSSSTGMTIIIGNSGSIWLYHGLLSFDLDATLLQCNTYLAGIYWIRIWTLDYYRPRGKQCIQLTLSLCILSRQAVTVTSLLLILLPMTRTYFRCATFDIC